MRDRESIFQQASLLKLTKTNQILKSYSSYRKGVFVNFHGANLKAKFEP